jgi:hypothetical protein
MPMVGLRSAVFAGRQSMRRMASSGKGGSPMRTQHNWLVAGGPALALATTVPVMATASAGAAAACGHAAARVAAA